VVADPKSGGRWTDAVELTRPHCRGKIWEGLTQSDSYLWEKAQSACGIRAALLEGSMHSGNQRQ
jgi:hypothetical protein